MMPKPEFSLIRIGLVLFWAIWLTLVAASNLADALMRLGMLPEGWTWASYNYRLIEETIGAHGVPPAVATALFAGVILWQSLAAALFWRATVAMRRGRSGRSHEATLAFAVSLALSAAFLIATEATVNYATASTHKATLIAQLATLLVIRSETAPSVTSSPSP